MVKFKLKIKEDAPIEDIEKEVIGLKETVAKEIPLSHIIKLAQLLKVEYLGGAGGSLVRFKHPYVDTFGNFFSVHVVHKGGEQMVVTANFKRYIYPYLMKIIDKSRLL